MDLKFGEVLHCPHCGKADDDAPVEDYVIPGKIGAPSRAETQCGWCDERFSVERIDEQTYRVEKA